MKTHWMSCCGATAVVALFVFGVGGCSRPETHFVEGKVVFDKKPVFPGTVLFKNAEGKIQTANLNSGGAFRVPDITNSSYVVAIQTPNIDFKEGSAELPSENKADGKPLIREKTVPEKFKNANTKIPAKFRSFETTSLTYDFTAEIPSSLVIDLDSGS
jgi:hypothetical protein